MLVLLDVFLFLLICCAASSAQQWHGRKSLDHYAARTRWLEWVYTVVYTALALDLVVSGFLMLVWLQ